MWVRGLEPAEQDREQHDQDQHHQQILQAEQQREHQPPFQMLRHTPFSPWFALR